MEEKLLWELSRVAQNPKQQQLLEDLATWVKKKPLTLKQQMVADQLYKQLRFRLILNYSMKFRQELLKIRPDLYCSKFSGFLKDDTFCKEDKVLIIKEIVNHHTCMPIKDKLALAYGEALMMTNTLKQMAN